MTGPWRLEDFLLPPPFPALVAILVVVGFVDVGARLARFLIGTDADADDRAAGFFLSVGLAAAAVHALALGQTAQPVLLRAIAWALALAGAMALPAAIGVTRRTARASVEAFRLLSPIDRLALALCGILVAVLSVAALAPATAPDSLDVHLGAPLDWLRHGGAFPRPDWYHARFAGLGEAINMMGIAG